MAFQDGPVLFRYGGYWWDGTTWYRPGRVYDMAREEFFRRPVPAAATVTAADMLADGSADADRGYILGIGDVDPDKPYAGRWPDELALWAQRHGGDLARSVVSLTAPELAADRLASVADMAEITGIAASTLRSYIARDEADVPIPQAVIGTRSLWSRPVAEEWAEQRRRSPDGVIAAVSGATSGERAVSPGQAELAAGLARSFFASLWEYRPFRGRWSLRWRNDRAVREVADALGSDAADYMLNRLLPAGELSTTIEHAVLDELSYGQQLHNSTKLPNRGDPADDDDDAVFYGITPGVARTLDWLVRHWPDRAAYTIGAITGEAERRFSIPRSVTEYSVRTALNLDGELDNAVLNEFLARVFAPKGD
jgi:hypothetical protein